MTASVRFPPELRRGDRVGVAALSGPVDGDCLARGLEELRRLGFAPVPAPNLALRNGFFAGSDDERLDGLHHLAADPDVAAIFFARGGHGALRLMPRVDWELLARRPRAYVGYSDLTVFLSEVVRQLGLVAYHGPMVAVEMGRPDGLAPVERDSLLAALAGRPAAVVVRGAGEAGGTLAGGCLSLLAATLGTPFAPHLDGAVLFVEDVAEPLFRLDRMLTQLRLSGSLDRVRAVVIGCLEPEAADPPAPTIADWLEQIRCELAVPVAWGCSSGHVCPNLTLPLGAACHLHANAGRLVFAAG